MCKFQTMNGLAKQLIQCWFYWDKSFYTCTYNFACIIAINNIQKCKGQYTLQHM